ncbi:MAG: hypothetical protein A2Y15_00740 [Clostridiales bacterium GWF2_36_10]|nr:MAG: hypothetical protein A2Y15_00740 [Clostridiales bacterium GWF2_36_10]HAN21505.1 hypothetical protein [Clostridiales bacterium]
MTRRKKSSQTLIGIILCIPIAFIAYFIISYSSHNISPESVNSISITLPSGEQYTYDDREQIDFFVNAQLDSKRISTPVRDITNESPVVLQYDRGDKLVNFKLYPQLNLSGCMLVDSDNTMFLMATDTAGDLLVRPEFQYLYNESLLPILSVVSSADSAGVFPASYEWHYKKVDGNYYSDSITKTYDEAPDAIKSIYPNTGSTLKFSIEPNEYEVLFKTENGTTIGISDLSYLNFDNDTKIQVLITAKWNETNSADFYGEATYSFPLLYDIPAVVTLEKKTFDAGDVALLNIQHLNENEKITVSTPLETSGITCYTEGENTFALLPISGNNTSGEYTINIEVGGAAYSDTVTVKEKDVVRELLSVSDEEYNEMLSEEVVKDATDKLNAVFGKPSAEAFYTFGTKFTVPVNGSIIDSYGKEVIISKDATTRKVIGTIYGVSEGTPVKATQRGKIVFTQSLAATGNTVIIDHGFGIMTCYFNLMNFNCAVGDVVQQGEIIAESGSTGFTNGKSILDYAVAVNGVFINPNTFFNTINLSTDNIS